MNDLRIRQLIIVGGGTAGWMAAASFAHHFAKQDLAITVVESTDIPTIGVGEATIPAIRDYYRALGIDEFDLMRATQATCKLGIEFKDWSQPGKSFFHPFGLYGAPTREVPFHQYWLRVRQHGDDADLGLYSLAVSLMRANRFTRPHANPTSPLSVFDWALHFDASLFARYLRNYSLDRGVRRIDRKVVGVDLRPLDGFVDALRLEDGVRLEGDLFIDCTGFRGLLIEGALQTGYEDWTHSLPCDRAVAIPCESTSEPTPYTRATALASGWQWRIPLQHRMGNGYVYCSRFISDDEAVATLRSNLEGEVLAEPNLLRFTTGIRKRAWSKNVVSLGLASGFIEPLESTSISLVETGIEKLRRLFPDRTFDPALRDEYNRCTRLEFERIRDFLILHYKANSREDSAFWRECKQITMPEPLEYKVRLFRARGYFVRYEWETFQDPSWLSMYAGFNWLPDSYDRLADYFDLSELRHHLSEMRRAIANATAAAPTHAEFIRRHCG